MVRIMAILAMICLIEFPANNRRDAFEIRRINACDVSRGWEALTNTATLKLPRNVKGLDQDNLKQWIRRGDQVKISLGYNTDYFNEFEGYVTEVDADIPITIKCEDLMWKLKQVSAKYSSSNAKVTDILEKIIPSDLGITIDAVDASIGAFRTDKGVTVAQVLQKLKDIGIYCYFKGTTLYAGKIYTSTDKEAQFGFQRNIAANSLKYQFADDILLKVTAKSTLSNGEKLEVSVGDEDGQEQTLSYFNINSESELKALAQADLDRLKVDGYDGTLTSFGIPFVDHGYTAIIEDVQYPERSGNYNVDEVKTSFGSGGIRRTVKIGGQIS